VESSSVPSLSLSGHREQSLPGQNQSDSRAKNTSGPKSGSKQKDQNVPGQNQSEKSAQSNHNDSGKSGEKAGVSVGQDGCGDVRAESVKATAPSLKDSRGEDKNAVKKSEQIPGPATGRSQPESTKVP
jgi:hypothetical protein